MNTLTQNKHPILEDLIFNHAVHVLLVLANIAIETLVMFHPHGKLLNPFMSKHSSNSKRQTSVVTVPTDDRRAEDDVRGRNKAHVTEEKSGGGREI